MATTAPNRLANGHQMNSSNENNNEEDQLNRINLQALQNRDPYISKIVDQAQRVCVYKFIAEKREWERKDLEGTLFVYERMCEPFHGFVILSTVSRETFVQIIKSSMEFKHTPTYEAFLQYKVDVGDIYGIWFISKNDCPRVTECLKNLTQKAKEREQFKHLNDASNSNSIISLLSTAQDKFQETKRKPETTNNSETTAASMPPILMRLFSAQEPLIQNPDERGEELKITLGISGKPALSVTELEKQLLQPASNQQSTKPKTNTDNLAKPVPIPIQNHMQTPPPAISSRIITQAHSIHMNNNIHTGIESISINTNRLMTPADFQNLHIEPSPVMQPQLESSPSIHQFSRTNLRHLLVDMLQNDEDFINGLYNAYLEKNSAFNRFYS